MQTPDATGTAPTIAETLAKLGADDKTGLTDAEVQARLKKYGPNALVEKQKNAFAALLAYFWGPIPWMIEAAALIAFVVGDWGDFTIITSLLLFNALLGFWEEHEASNALDALKSSLALAVAHDDAHWTFLGILPLLDPPRSDSKSTIARARAYGVKVKMVTGDNVAIARQIASELDMGANIQPATELFPSDVTKGQIPLDAVEKIDEADGFAEVFPEHKYAIVKILQQNGHIVGMTGDGVNDAPALKQADVGIAVSGATEAARAAAALVLTAPGLSVIIDGIAEARRIFERMTSYVLYRIAMTIAIMVFVVLASIYYHFFPLTAIMLIAL